ncbi:hypothetical protein I79_021640 [Cricetulus griseus]|uniref:Uncharacterized protein n=1 Tax=Cricetulus griseus TaxID=10029 RepID=G3ID67_CRIGR|nr:hypothetical protein I79_021640 [Cricetulus griseus]
MEPNVWSGLVREARDASRGQSWRMPCFWPLRECSPGEGCAFCGEALPWQVAGLGGSPWNHDSGRGQCKPGSCSPAFSVGNQKPEALVKEEDLPEAPAFWLVLQQPPCLLNPLGPQPGAPQQEAQTSDPERLSQCGLPVASNWWRGGSVLRGFLECISSCPVFSFPPVCCPSVFGTSEP